MGPRACLDAGLRKIPSPYRNWWNMTGQGKPKYLEKNLIQYHFVHHKFHTVDNEINNNIKHSLRSTIKGYGGKTY